jgi:acetyltransferase-like isoleucine patch superfamily enzyme
MFKKIIIKIGVSLKQWFLDEKGKPPGVCCYGSNVTLGKNVTFGGNVFLFKTAPIHIGDNTMIACNVTIHTSTHDYNYYPMRYKRIDRPVFIGSDVWIGIGAIILPGVTIGDHAVVAAGSIVTSHIPSCAIVAGNPARIIKYKDIKKIMENNSFPEDSNKITAEGYLKKDKVCKKSSSISTQTKN